jgi:hypothetical protein
MGVGLIQAESLIDKSNIYISFTQPTDHEKDDKMKIFLDSSERMKIIKRDSLGQNGLKIYGLDFLIAKNKKLSSEHLIFISHPLENGSSGHIFIPFDVVSHTFYEKLLDDKMLLRNTVDSARNALRVNKF